MAMVSSRDRPREGARSAQKSPERAGGGPTAQNWRARLDPTDLLLLLYPKNGLQADMPEPGHTPIRPFQKTLYLRGIEADSSDVSGSEAQRGLCELIEKAKP